MFAKVKSAVIATATVLAVIAVAYRVPVVKDLVKQAILPPSK